jgi:hypothetical protein
MNRVATLALLLPALALTGCAEGGATPTTSTAAKIPSAENESSPEPSETPTPTPTPTPESEFGEAIKNERGNLVKEIGQLSGLSASDGSDAYVARFIVTEIKPDPKCNSGFVEEPKNGHFLLININVETTPELAKEEYPSLSFDNFQWQAYDKNGKRVNDPVGTSYSCLDAGDMLPNQIGPAQSASGNVVLDVPTTSGSIALTMGGPTGWEWTY